MTFLFKICSHIFMLVCAVCQLQASLIPKETTDAWVAKYTSTDMEKIISDCPLLKDLFFKGK